MLSGADCFLCINLTSLFFILVPFDSDGINVRALERELKTENSMIYGHLSDQTQASHGFWAVLYLVPAFHNPTGTVMPVGKTTPPQK